MDSVEAEKTNGQESVLQNSAENVKPNDSPGSNGDVTNSTQKAANRENKMESEDCQLENEGRVTEVEDLGPGDSDDERTRHTEPDPLNLEDINVATTNEGNTVALLENEMNLFNGMPPELLQRMSVSREFTLNAKRVENCPGAVLADTVVKNKTVVIEEKSSLSRLIDYTKRRLDRFNLDAFHETRAIKNARECLRNGAAFIEGPEKSGKTSMAFYLMKRDFSKYIPIYISKSDDLQTLGTVKDHTAQKRVVNGKEINHENFIICMENIFTLKGDTRAYLQDVLELVNEGSAHLIVTTADDVRKVKRQADYAGVLKDRYRTKLSDFPLEDHERYEILRCKSKSSRHLKHKVGGVEEEFLQEIAKSTNYPWFLWILDELEYLNPTPGPPLVTFFRHPTRFLVRQIKAMYDEEKEKFIALVMIMKGVLKKRSLKSPDSPNLPEASELFLSLISLLGVQMMPLTKVIEAAKEMMGEYVAFTDKHFVFIHDSLTKAVCQVVFEVSPDDAINWCPLSYIVEKTETMPGSDIDNIVLEETEQLELLKERLLKEGNMMEVFKHRGFSDPNFVRNIIKEFNIHSTQYNDILLQSITLRQSALVREITQHILRTLPEGGDNIKHLALEKACEVGNFEAYEELLKVGAEPNIACMKACKEGMNQRITLSVFEKFSSKFCQLPPEVIRDWNLTVAEVGNVSMLRELIVGLQGRPDKHSLIAVALEKIIYCGHYEKYQLIMREIGSLDWGKLIVAASEGGQDEILKDILRHIKDLGVNISLQDPFVAACKLNRRGVVEILNKYRGLVEMKTAYGQTPLQIAAGVGHSEDPEVLEWLILKKKDWDREAADIDGSTALHTACHAGNITAVDALLKAGFNPLAVDKDGNTSLHAHLNGRFVNKPAVLKLLEKAGKQTKKDEQKNSIVCVQNKDGNTPLHLMTMKKSPVYVSILQTLVEFSKGSVNIENIRGQTPLHILIASGGPSRAAEVLLENGFNLIKTDKDKETVLHLACLRANEEMIKKMANNVKKCQQILERRNANGWTPLHCYASTHGNRETVQLLCIDKNINAEDCMNQTALHIAVKVPGNSDVPAVLLDKGAQINAEDNRTQTALHILCRHSHSTSCDLAQTLLQRGANIHANDHKHQTPLHHVCLSEGLKSSELVDMLVSHGAKILKKDVCDNTSVHSCCATCCDQSAKVLQTLLKHLKENSDYVQQAIMTGDEHGDTPLHKVCLSQGKHKREVAKILIDEGADVSMTNNDGDTVLDISRRNGITDITQLLIETTLISSCSDRDKLQNVNRILSCELSPDVDNEERLSQMMKTVLQTHGPHTISVLDLLIGRGADVKRTTVEGYTVVHLAAMTQGEFTDDVIGYLITKGADVFQKDQNGETALHKVSTGQTKFSSKLIKFLSSNGLSATDKDNRGNTPLHTLFGELNRYYKESMEELVTLTCDVDLVDLPNAQQKTPCDLARLHGKKVIGELFETYCTKRRVLNLKPLQHLIYRGADINRMDSGGNTVLHRICMKRVTHVCNNVRLLLELGADKTLYNNVGKSAFDLACETGLDEDVRELTVVEMPDDLDTDGASAASTPSYSRSSSYTRSPQPSLPCPEWFRRSSSTESWEGELRSGMQGIRNAAGMVYFDKEMEEFEQRARYKQKNFFKRHM